MRDHEEEFNRLQVKIVVVTFEHGFLAQRYVEETSLSWPLLVDTTRKTYRTYGMLSASFWDIFGPKTWLAYIRGLRRGEKLRKSEGDIFQRGGDVLIDPAGIIALHHVGAGPADRPEVGTILRKIARE